MRDRSCRSSSSAACASESRARVSPR
jgi:hypothetical protein